MAVNGALLRVLQCISPPLGASVSDALVPPRVVQVVHRYMQQESTTVMHRMVKRYGCSMSLLSQSGGSDPTCDPARWWCGFWREERARLRGAGAEEHRQLVAEAKVLRRTRHRALKRVASCRDSDMLVRQWHCNAVASRPSPKLRAVMQLSRVWRRACQTWARLALAEWQRGWVLAHQREAWKAKEEVDLICT